MSLLNLSGLSVSLGGAEVVKDLALEIAAGEFVGLIGPNGAGKSTLLRAVLGSIRCEGEISMDGRRAADLSVGERARRIAYLPQDREIAWPVAVERVVALGRMPHRRPGPGDLTVADRTVVRQAMEAADVAHLEKRRATDLSGGERARVLIARALAQCAPLLMADEPTAGLDPAHQIACMRVFADLAANGSSVLACLHDLGLAARWCTRIILMARGRIVADGAPRDVLTADRLAEVYGIRAHFGEAEGGMVIQPLDLVEDVPARLR
ncbi:iron complex transport system ATP-binding protein [Breoghania corrubedonensis]|uniref:Iron complex transport system ATP-binding protein n=1 Tax=Breoghania corrubedonensis TaxID=665038 RepID=A0A2T5VA67_9HYPH|nr:ABC transporter ATP-binding protein [Breoghania corrubedonensis]PTW60621.1 iron complex transport system ATP-binding protein [Breoghania corrubedonensis]